MTDSYFPRGLWIPNIRHITVRYSASPHVSAGHMRI